MSVSLGSCLPEEMLAAILIRLDDGAWWGLPTPKRGLASCSLVCRHWAKTIRPLLFDRISLRSADDIELLLTFLAAPALFGKPLTDYIRSLHIIEDCASHARTPWSHHIPLYLSRFAPNVSAHWTFEGQAAGENGPTPSFRRPSLPRRLPMKACQFRHVTLSGLQLTSVQCLADLVKDLPPTCLRLLDITFADESPDLFPLQQSWPLRVPPLLRELHITRCFKGSANLDLWLHLSCLLFAGRGYAPPDDEVRMSLLTFLDHCMSLHKRQDSKTDLQINIMPLLQNEDTEHVDGWNYRFTLDDFATVYVRTELGFQPCIESASIVCPQLDDAGLSALDRLATIFADTALHGPCPTSISIHFSDSASCKPLLAAILDARVFATPSAFLLRLIVSLPYGLGYTVAEILSAPRSVGEEDLCVALTTAQRMEWVLRAIWSANLEYIDERDDYLRELQDAACAAGRMAATDAGVARGER